MTVDQRFRLRDHLRRQSEFAHVYAQRCRAGDGKLQIYVARNDLAWSRLGLSVGRKVSNAVRRNRIRRGVREAFRLSKASLPKGLDIVCVVTTDLTSLDYDIARTLETMINKATQRLG